MNADIAEDIKAIRTTLEKNNRHGLILIIITAIAVSSIFIHDKYFNDNFCRNASNLYEMGKIKELRSLADKRKIDHPNDPDIYWYLAKADSLEGNIEQAKQDLAHLKSIAPNWDKDYIQPMLEAMQDKN